MTLPNGSTVVVPIHCSLSSGQCCSSNFFSRRTQKEKLGQLGIFFWCSNFKDVKQIKYIIYEVQVPPQSVHSGRGCAFHLVVIFNIVETQSTQCLYRRNSLEFVKCFWHSDQRFSTDILTMLCLKFETSVHAKLTITRYIIYNFPEMVPGGNLHWG